MQSSNGSDCTMKGIKYIAAGFVQDADKLLIEFVNENSNKFSVFTHFWKKHNFSAVFLGRSSAELQQFTHEIFQITLKFLMSDNILHQIGAVYLLYSLFRNQIVEPPTRIRVVFKQYQQFLELRKLAIKEKYMSLHYVIGYLMEHGFDCVAHPSLVGPRNAKHSMEVEKKELQLDCKLKELKKFSSSLFKSNLLEDIIQLNDEYSKFRNHKILKNLFEETGGLDIGAHLGNLSKLIGADRSDSEGNNQTDQEKDNIGSRRAQIKSNAFESKAWFRHLNPKDEDDEENFIRRTRSSTQRQLLRSQRKLLIEDEEDEESDEKEVKPKKRRRVRLPKERRRIGRPRKGQELEKLLMVDNDIDENDIYKGFRKRGPSSRTSYLDDYKEQPFEAPDEEIMLSSTSEEENCDESVKPENSDESEEEYYDETTKAENCFGSEEEDKIVKEESCEESEGENSDEPEEEESSIASEENSDYECVDEPEEVITLEDT